MHPVSSILEGGLWMEIRRLQESDHKLLATAIQLLIPEEDRRNNVNRTTHLQQALANRACYFILCLVEAKPVGYLSAYCFPDVENADFHVYLFDIVVTEQFWRQGIGTGMIEVLKQHCRADQVSRIWVGAEINNEAAQRLYVRTGAQKSETSIEYIYQLELTP